MKELMIIYTPVYKNGYSVFYIRNVNLEHCPYLTYNLVLNNIGQSMSATYLMREREDWILVKATK